MSDPKPIQCLTCVFEQTSGTVVDESKSNKEWGRVIGVNEASIRRHKKHRGSVENVAAGSEVHRPDGSSDYSRFSEEPWGYENFRTFIRERGQDPDKVTFTFGWTSNPGGGFWNKLNNVKPIADTAVEAGLSDLSTLYATVTEAPRKTISNQKRATVVCLADWQIGKTGRRGGSAETLQRLANARAELEKVYAERQPGTILLLDLGDGIEGFESGGDPQFTNDLSLPDQLDAYSTEVFKFVAQAYSVASDVKVGAVPSNHAAWRRGKQSLGKPSDDFGLYVHREVSKVSKAAGYEVSWYFPDDYDETLCVDVLGTGVGAVHGNQFGPNKAIDWWQAQAFGSQAITKADVLATGHYHSWGSGVAGINPFSGRERYWLGAPTLDNGSDWYRGLRGRDSLPGTLVFDITEDGFDLGTLKIV
jgi:hypothetical protein